MTEGVLVKILLVYWIQWLQLTDQQLRKDEIYEIRWDQTTSDEIRWDHMRSDLIRWDQMRWYKIQGWKKPGFKKKKKQPIIQSYLILSHLSWYHLISSDLVQSHDFIYSHLISSDLIQSHQISSNFIWFLLISSELIWSHLFQSDLIWSYRGWSKKKRPKKPAQKNPKKPT